MRLRSGTNGPRDCRLSGQHRQGESISASQRATSYSSHEPWQVTGAGPGEDACLASAIACRSRGVRTLPGCGRSCSDARRGPGFAVSHELRAHGRALELRPNPNLVTQGVAERFPGHDERSGEDCEGGGTRQGTPPRRGSRDLGFRTIPYHLAGAEERLLEALEAAGAPVSGPGRDLRARTCCHGISYGMRHSGPEGQIP